MAKRVRKAVFPVAGLGTRFLPVTKAMPKEMLPVVDKPLIQYAFEEATAAGIEECYFVTGRAKNAIEDHFDTAAELEMTLRERGKDDLLKELDAIVPTPGRIAYTRQQRPLGLGHAVWCARHLVGDEPFAVLLADDLMVGDPPCLAEMVEAHARTGGNMVAVMEIPREETRRYGILDVVEDHGKLVRAKGVVEKPEPAVAPSTLMIIGRYIIQPEIFRHLGDATAGAQAGGKKVAVGYDGRLTSPELEAALVDGLAEGGVDVVRTGRGPTPMLYFAAATLGVDGGIMVTGSHNPPDHNGFKLVLRGKAFFGEAIQKIGEAALKLGPPGAKRGEATQHSVFNDYVASLAKDYDDTRQLKVSCDCGNGATGEVVVELTKTLPGRHILLNEIIDGTFPAHHPDPTVAENLVQLQQAVKEHRCDLGIGFDGDGDRIGVIDAQGRILWGDQLLIVLARDVLQHHPGAPVLADVKASQILFDAIAEAGGKPVMMETGHSLIKARLAETGAPLAGEMSGHIFFADRWYGFDDAVYVAVRLLGILSRAPETLADMLDRLPPVFNTPELRLPCEEERKFAIVEEVRERLRKRGAEMVEIDGVRVRTPDGWWLLRASNTQAIVVVRAESSSEAGLQRLKEALAKELAASRLTLPDA